MYEDPQILVALEVEYTSTKTNIKPISKVFNQTFRSVQTSIKAGNI